MKKCTHCKGLGKQSLDNGFCFWEWVCETCNGLGFKS